MAQIELAPEIASDLKRILEHLAHYEGADVSKQIEQIIQAISVLEHSPCIGRPANGDLRGLFIGRRQGGFIALYRYVAKLDTVFVLAIRSQREAGFRWE